MQLIGQNAVQPLDLPRLPLLVHEVKPIANVQINLERQESSRNQPRLKSKLTKNSPPTTTDRNKKSQLSQYAQRLIKYFPDLANKDEYITEFTVEANRSDIIQKKLDPDSIKYNRPDFGFNDYMIFDEDSKVDAKHNGWVKIMDCVKIYPQFERVRNYIDFIHEKKIAQLSDKHGVIKGSSNTSPALELSSPGRSRIFQKRQQLELLRQVELQKSFGFKTKQEKSKKSISKDEAHIFDLKEDLGKLSKDLKSEKEWLHTIQRQARNSNVVGQTTQTKESSPITPQMQRKITIRLSKSPRQKLNRYEYQQDRHQSSQLKSTRETAEATKLSTRHSTLSKSLKPRQSSNQRSSITRIPIIKSVAYDNRTALESLRSQLIEKLDQVLRITADNQKPDYIYGWQALKLLSDRRFARIIPRIHFKILISSNMLTANEISQNARTLLQYAKYFQPETDQTIFKEQSTKYNITERSEDESRFSSAYKMNNESMFTTLASDNVRCQSQLERYVEDFKQKKRSRLMSQSQYDVVSNNSSRQQAIQ